MQKTEVLATNVPLLTWHDLPLKSRDEYADDKDELFVQHGMYLFCLNEITRIGGTDGWHGLYGISYDSGFLSRFTEDEDAMDIGYLTNV
jgi:hypothetical protein